MRFLPKTQTESETEIETATQEEIAELVKEAVADENTSSKELYEIIDKQQRTAVHRFRLKMLRTLR